MPIMGLQTTAEVAHTVSPVIDPAHLSVQAYEVDGVLLDEHPMLLRIADVRELSDIGMIIDSADEFVAPDDVVKLAEIYQLHFALVGMNVLDDKRRKLGKVDDYTLDTDSFYIQQLNVRRPLIKSFGDTELLVHRTQIIEINDQAIIVRSGEQTSQAVAQAVRSYVNPFRSSPQTEVLKREQN